MIALKLMMVAMLFTVGSHGEEAHKHGLIITEHEIVYEESIAYVVGVLTNQSDYSYSHLQIEVSLYNDEEIHVGSMLESVDGLEPYGTWEFKIPIPHDITSYAFSNLSGM